MVTRLSKDISLASKELHLKTIRNVFVVLAVSLYYGRREVSSLIQKQLGVQNNLLLKPMMVKRSVCKQRLVLVVPKVVNSRVSRIYFINHTHSTVQDFLIYGTIMLVTRNVGSLFHHMQTWKVLTIKVIIGSWIKMVISCTNKLQKN